jgi:hypothetical protein
VALFTTPRQSNGTLLLNGAFASSFAQADINNGLVRYQDIANGVGSDTLYLKDGGATSRRGSGPAAS